MKDLLKPRRVVMIGLGISLVVWCALRLNWSWLPNYLPLIPLAIWRTGFTRTYGAELRAERGDRPDKVVDFDPDFYRRIGQAVHSLHPGIADADPAGLEARWRALAPADAA